MAAELISEAGLRTSGELRRKRFRINLVVMRAHGMKRGLSMRCLCLAEMAQIRWILTFDGDEKVLAMVAAPSDEKHQGRNGSIFNFCINF